LVTALDLALVAVFLRFAAMVHSSLLCNEKPDQIKLRTLPEQLGFAK
jgi:hypothetical protein